MNTYGWKKLEHQRTEGHLGTSAEALRLQDSDPQADCYYVLWQQGLMG